MVGFLENKVAIITGAASGIGLEMAKTFATAGAKVVISDLNALAISCDVTDEKQIEAMIQETIDTFGRIDIVVNNAGLQHVSNIESFPTEKFEQMLKVMVTAPFIVIKHVFPVMKKQKFGRIINIASIEKVLEEVIYPLVPQKRLLSTKEVADYAAFIASEKAGGITGQAIVIDGGYTTQ